ncbi:MAG: family 20 glycosylhydrolase [bacterium]
MPSATPPLTLFHMDFNFVCLSTPYIRSWLEKLARMGYTGILWEVEDKVRWSTCPECAWPEAISKPEFREILDFAASLGLEAIPLLQTIGHAEYVLLQEKYRPFRERPDEYTCYCTSRPEVRSFLKKWIEEYLDLFGEIRYFHLGGDEAYAFATCPECASYSRKHGRNRLYAEHVCDLAGPILSRGVRPAIWCDMVLHYPEELHQIPKDFVIWDWNYWSYDQANPPTRVWGHNLITKEQLTPEILATYPQIVNDRGDLVPFYTADFLTAAGFDVVLCSASRSHGDSVFCPDFELHYQNVAGVAKKTALTALLGQCVTSWAIRLNPLETQDIILRLAPMALRNPEKPARNLLTEIGMELFGINPDPFFKAVLALGRGFAGAGSGTTAIQWSRGKDSLPAPPDYIASLIESMERDNPEELKALQDKLRQVSSAFPQALSELAVFLHSASSGFEQIEPWLTAGYFQVQHSRLATLIFTGQSDPCLIPWAQHLKRRLADWLACSETQKSADKNAGLVYDSLIEFLMNPITIPDHALKIAALEQTSKHC